MGGTGSDTSVTSSDAGREDAWNRWREARRHAVTGPEGSLALVDTCWPDESERLPGLPGRWTVVGDEVWLAAEEADQVTVDGDPLSGERRVSGAGAGAAPMVRFPGGSATVVVRGGQFGVRRFDPAAPAASGFEDIDTSPFDPDWIVPARYTPFPGREVVNYAKMLESGPTELEVPGELRFTVGGREYRTTPLVSEGRLLLVFSDATTGVSSYRPGRFLRVTRPDVSAGGTARVLLDFNRAYLPPCAFSAHFNCPLPPANHQFDVAVPVGERTVRYR
ncbi:DUF1684 domain-containing protein [Actinoalloteichus sp. AHMU CJ021]|uniref:DUF1684 domain-containing protein n=1 Tax=Actinoalloteichus caeruleus DSM 43889 TaxID=1120930 RepID=A0ABT1JBT9_ACTCY|nr:DUF1684 domain-containing protein [Actinoalloteichus caeruleus]AUS79479.1 DUF1684 domain-containing protein [Actinoalloteichus sp. AHMU CJ021]MCP2329764.1 hypothetical protein [Actinoalloteichus caeruleus DSM 43889]